MDTLTVEDNVLKALTAVTDMPIKSLRIGRDSLTNTSRGVCYVEMNSVVDAMFLHNQLLGEPPTIDGKLVSVSYYSTPQSAVSGGGNVSGSAQSASAASAAMAAAQWSHQGNKDLDHHQQHPSSASGGKMSEEEIERMAQYSAGLYAKSAEEKESYLAYYRNLYRSGGAGTAKPGDPKDLGKVTVNGVEYKKYRKYDLSHDPSMCSLILLRILSSAVPDVSTYTYEETSGYYYDPTTGLYYDAKSQYYYNSTSNEYMYWSAEHSTYLPANNSGASKSNEPEDDSVVDKKKAEKVKTAKKIAKDMEKWAKTLNQKKEKSAQPPPPESPAATKKSAREQQSSAEDIAFSIMLKKPVSSNNGLSKLANYGSDSEDDPPASAKPPPPASQDPAEAPRLTDWDKMACLLCKRQFPSKEKLQK